MKKSIRILALALLLLLAITATATATQPDMVQGRVPLTSLEFTDTTLEYDACDPVMVGHAVQPLSDPGFRVQGTLTFGNVPNCGYTTTLEGTCDYVLIPVESFGDPDSKLGRMVLTNCTGDAAGLHGRAQINFDYTYTLWYHWEP